MDIKQQNILIDDFLMVKLTDFSVSINYKLAKNYINLPLVGTSFYMSPEVLNKKRISVAEASKIDIYSFGVLLYYLAFGYYPYNLNEVKNKEYSKIAKNIEENELKFPEEDTGHSKMFVNFIKNCLNKDIKKRYNIYKAMNDPWLKGYQIILNEKEKLYNANKFIVDLMVDNLINFNKYYEDEKLKENY
jgi:serine/threonine protein kinase